MNLRHATLALAVAATAVTADAQSVRIAERPSAGPFPTLQAAVDAALEGESLLVAPGNYAPFTIDGKSVRLFVTGTGSLVKISGQVVVRNIGAGQSVLLSRLDLTGVHDWVSVPPALEIASVAGHVRVQDCTVRGAVPPENHHVAGGAARVTASLNVVFSGCNIQGHSMGYLSGYWPVHGGAGIEAVNSSLALYDCIVKGGNGSEETVPTGGNGAAACSLVSYGIFAAGCTFTGGRGGGGDFTGCYDGGAGGDGLRLQSAQAHLLENTYAGGAGGWTLCGLFGIPGQGIGSYGNSIVDHLPGTKRKLVAPLVVADDIPAQVTVTGQSGDRVFLLTATRPSFLWKRTFNGVWMVPTPLLVSAVAQGTIGANGSLVIPRTFDVFAGPSKVHWLQAICVDTAGVPTLTGPAHVLSINAGSGPDCNGNGRHDFVDVLFGGASDCDQNLTPDPCDPDCDQSGIPDACEIANGTSPDCNGNGVPDACDLASGLPDCNANGILDSCDIANGTSTDVNGNGVPDECEPHNATTWHVDDSAAPGGNGSANAPFQNLFDAIAVSFSGDTIELADGLYQGPNNRALDLNGRHLTLRSAQGSGQCILDAQGMASFLIVVQGEHVVLEGIRFENGKSSNDGGAMDLIGGELTARNCVFANCSTLKSGGALRVAQGIARIEACTFIGNSCAGGPFGSGGALAIDTAELLLRDCLFFDNEAELGGALTVYSQVKARISHCSFLANHAEYGGAIYNRAPVGSGGISRIDDCLFAGNRADFVGGALIEFTKSAITSSTFVDNSAGGEGGALSYIRSLGGTLENCILWGNTASHGSQIELGDASGGLSSLTIAYCDVQGGQAGVGTLSGNLTWGPGNLDLLPHFTDPDGADNDPQTFIDNDYTLRLTSPCIDAGSNALLALDFLDVDGDGNFLELVPWDLRHLPRRVDQPGVPDTGAGTAPITDMGAYEH